jgi:hypothetical protein
MMINEHRDRKYVEGSGHSDICLCRLKKTSGGEEEKEDM